MKSIISKTTMLVALAVILLSFTSTFGGEGFEISLNGKVVLQQYGKQMDVVKTLQLNAASPNEKLTIRYYHCGKIAKNRIVTIKNGQDKLLKEWHFKDPKSAFDDMSCNVQDLINLQKGSDQVLKLYYSSSELPNGRQLATVSVDSRQYNAAVITK